MAGVVKHGDLKRNGEAAQKVRATVKDPSKAALSAALNDDATNAPAFSFGDGARPLPPASNRHTGAALAITVEQDGACDYAAVGEGVFGPVEQLDDRSYVETTPRRWTPR